MKRASQDLNPREVQMEESRMKEAFKVAKAGVDVDDAIARGDYDAADKAADKAERRARR